MSKEDRDKINEGDLSASIQNQKLLLMDYAVANQFEVYEVYVDDDYSGMDSERPAFQRLIRDVENGCFSTIICKTQSRFTREMELVEKYIHGLFPIMGVRFIGVVDHVDTNIKGNKKARQINGLINEWYCEDLSDNIRSVFKTKMEKGEFIGSFAPYGYIKDPINHHRLIIDEEAALIVRKIYEYAKQGLNTSQICDELYQQKIPTPSIYKKMKGLKFQIPNDNFYSEYGLWGKSTVNKILRNRVYIGDMVQGKERKVSYKSKKMIHLPRKDWIIVPHCHEPIIDKEIFEEVEKITSNRRYMNASKISDNKELLLLAGKVRCKDCHSILTRVNGNTKYISYYCQLHKRSKKELCSPHSIRYDSLLQIIEEKIKEVIVLYLDREKIKSELSKYELDIRNIDADRRKEEEKITTWKIVEDKLQKLTKKVDNVTIDIGKTKKAITMLYIDKTTNVITLKEYKELKKDLYQELDQLVKEEEKYTKELSESEKILEELKKIEDCESYHLSLTNSFNTTNQLDVRKKSENYMSDEVIQKIVSIIKLNHEVMNEFIDYIEVGEKDVDKRQEIIIHYNF